MTASLDQWQDVLRWMPESVREAIPIVAWRRDVLWSLALPAEHVLGADLAWLLDLPLWATGGIPFRVSPNAVREEPNRYPDQFRRAMASDLDDPVHLTWHNGRWTILDGFHLETLPSPSAGRGALWAAAGGEGCQWERAAGSCNTPASSPRTLARSQPRSGSPLGIVG